MTIRDQILDHISLLNGILINEGLFMDIEKSINLLSSVIEKNLPILVFGNGGSASDALHITGELVGRFLKERKPVNIICLNSNVSVITAWANDYDYNTVFARQIEAHAKKGGVCWGISTSGNSLNVIEAFEIAKKLGMKTISLTGHDGGKLKYLSDFNINVPSKETPRIQEVHLLIYHYICEKIEQKLN